MAALLIVPRIISAFSSFSCDCVSGLYGIFTPPDQAHCADYQGKARLPQTDNVVNGNLNGLKMP